MSGGRTEIKFEEKFGKGGKEKDIAFHGEPGRVDPLGGGREIRETVVVEDGTVPMGNDEVIVSQGEKVAFPEPNLANVENPSLWQRMARRMSGTKAGNKKVKTLKSNYQVLGDVLDEQITQINKVLKSSTDPKILNSAIKNEGNESSLKVTGEGPFGMPKEQYYTRLIKELRASIESQNENPFEKFYDSIENNVGDFQTTIEDSGARDVYFRTRRLMVAKESLTKLLREVDPLRKTRVEAVSEQGFGEVNPDF